jgi:hypothetical protein
MRILSIGRYLESTTVCQAVKMHSKLSLTLGGIALGGACELLVKGSVLKAGGLALRVLSGTCFTISYPIAIFGGAVTIAKLLSLKMDNNTLNCAKVASVSTAINTVSAALVASLGDMNLGSLPALERATIGAEIFFGYNLFGSLLFGVPAGIFMLLNKAPVQPLAPLPRARQIGLQDPLAAG